jgi:hypothetical protein
MIEITGIRKEIQNQNLKLLPDCLAKKPAAMCGSNIIGISKSKNTSTIFLYVAK